MQRDAVLDGGGTLVTRRHFVKGMGITGLLGRLGLDQDLLGSETVNQTPATLSGNYFNLEIAAKTVNFTGYGSTAAYSLRSGEPVANSRFIFGLRLWY